MQDEKNQPTKECNQAGGNSNEHEPTHYAEGVKQFAVILSVDDAGMYRAFIYLAPVRIGNRSAPHH